MRYDDNRGYGRAGNFDSGYARGAAADTGAMLVFSAGCRRFIVAGRRCRGVVRMVLCPSSLCGERTLMGSAKPEHARFPDREGDPESDKSREKPEPPGIAHQVHNV